MYCLKETIANLAKDGIKYAAKFAKDQYPKILSHKEKFENKVSEAAEEATPAVEKAHDSFSKFVMNKYSEALTLSKKAEEEKKKNKMKTIRNTIIATTIGFGAGAATGYLLVKKSQIKESDYVFSDEEISEDVTDPKMTAIPGGKAPVEPEVEPEPQPQPQAQPEPLPPLEQIAQQEQKTYQAFNDTYQISTDGTTLIKR